MSELIIAIKSAIREGNEPQIYELLNLFTFQTPNIYDNSALQGELFIYKGDLSVKSDSYLITSKDADPLGSAFEMLKGVNKIDASNCIDLSLEAAKAGQLRLLRIFHRIGFIIHEKVLRAALPYPPCLRYAVRHLSERLSGYQMERIMESCAIYQTLESICILEEAGWCLPRLLCQQAAKGGQLDILDYAFRNGCLLDTTVKYIYGECISYIVPCITSSTAAIEDRIECLGYVIQNGCKLREEFCEDAVRLNEPNILRYLRENPYRACPWKPEQLLPLAKGVIKEYIEYCLYDISQTFFSIGVYCGERGYVCGKSGCWNCSVSLMETKPRSMSI